MAAGGARTALLALVLALRSGRSGSGPGLCPRRLPGPDRSGRAAVRHALHQRWYRRFWTGDCDHLPLCFAGSPNWNDIVGKLLTRGGPAERAALLPKACRLGQMIGLEWARDKKVRRIDTGDLRAFKGQLEASGDALRGIERVEASARAKMAR
jgi:hypothetical protein